MSTRNRRQHRMFETLHTEYHLRLDECVGVRDKSSGEWYRDHPALRLRAIQVPTMDADAEWLGRRLQFWLEINPILNSIKDLSERTQAIRGYL